MPDERSENAFYLALPSVYLFILITSKDYFNTVLDLCLRGGCTNK